MSYWCLLCCACSQTAYDYAQTDHSWWRLALSAPNHYLTLKTENCYGANFAITAPGITITESWHYDNPAEPLLTRHHWNSIGWYSTEPRTTAQMDSSKTMFPKLSSIGILVQRKRIQPKSFLKLISDAVHWCLSLWGCVLNKELPVHVLYNMMDLS